MSDLRRDGKWEPGIRYIDADTNVVDEGGAIDGMPMIMTGAEMLTILDALEGKYIPIARRREVIQALSQQADAVVDDLAIAWEAVENLKAARHSSVLRVRDAATKAAMEWLEREGTGTFLEGDLRREKG